MRDAIREQTSGVCRSGPHPGPPPLSAGEGEAAESPLPRVSGGGPGWGWRRLLIAGLCGALATLALPPAYAAPLLLVAVPGLLRLLGGATSRRSAFALGWWFGFGHFVFGLYWISFALLTDIATFWWLMPVAIAGLPAVLAVFPGLVTLALWSL